MSDPSAGHGPVNGPDGPVKGFQDTVIASAMKWERDGVVFTGSVIKEQEREGAYIASNLSVTLESVR